MTSTHENEIQYPYLPIDKVIRYVPKDNTFILAAKEFARDNSLDKTMPSAAVIVKEGEVIGIGANGSEYHKHNECERVKLGCKSGTGYELCEGCHPQNHSEPSAIRDALANGNTTEGADLYLWGHWWFCKDCWDAMIEAGIKDVYVMEGSEILFNNTHPDNVIGRQFE